LLLYECLDLSRPDPEEGVCRADGYGILKRGVSRGVVRGSDFWSRRRLRYRLTNLLNSVSYVGLMLILLLYALRASGLSKTIICLFRKSYIVVF
jgi:hypothetical protein